MKHTDLRLLIALFSFIPGAVLSQAPAEKPTDELKKLSIEELMSVEVTSVSKRPEKLMGAASAIQVITQEDIQASGATNVPEALRLATNLQVAQVNASQWAISARGFNNVLSNKLLVLIDGRVVYTPLYAGVFWDIQNLLLADVDRIEVISGPGGTLWGANAVNGVINITTKSSAKTQGLLVEAGVGSELKRYGSLRYGGKIGKNLSYRAYAMAFQRGSTLDTSRNDSHDAWKLSQGGVRLDWDPSSNNLVSVISNFYSGDPNPDGTNHVTAVGTNVLARWSHSFSDRSDSKLQLYYDQTWRDFRNGFAENLKTYDLDWQHQFQTLRRHQIVWGAGARLMDHNVQNLELFSFLPARKTLHLFSTFIQDQITLVENRLTFTIGSKFEHNNYTGFQYQPSGRLSWMPSERQTFWASISGAVRTPARIDRDFYLFLAPGVPFIAGGNFQSEKMTAYELGWRYRPHEKFSMALSTFYNDYDNLRTVEPSATVIPVTFGNGLRGTTYGAEFSGTWQVNNWWKIRGGYTLLRKDLTLKTGSNDSNKGTGEADDPKYQYLVQSTMNIPGGLQLGIVLRYVDALPQPKVDGYSELDIRIGWRVKSFGLSVVGQNLLASDHAEFMPTSPSPRLIQRGVFGKISWQIPGK